MSDSEFDSCFEELEKLRAEFLKSNKAPCVSALKPAMELAQTQLSCIQTMNELFRKVSTNTINEEQLQDNNNAIMMPNSDSVQNFIGVVKTGLELCKESVRDNICELGLHKHFTNQQNANLNRLRACELNNNEFNRKFRETEQFFNPAPEELEEASVNTIGSEDVVASSPI